MAAITPIKYAETSTGGVRNPMRDFVSNLPNIYNQYLTILDRNRQRELQDAQFTESKRQFEETQALEQEKFKAQNLQNLNANTLEQIKVNALNRANEDNRRYQQNMLAYTQGEPGRRINEKFIDFYLNSFGNPFGFSRGSSGSSSSDSSGGYKRDAGLDTRIQKEIDNYYSLAKDIDSLSTYIAKLKNTSNDEELNEWFIGLPKEEQDNFLRVSALSGKKLGEKMDYAGLADSLSVQLDKKHSQAQSVYENMANYIDNTNKELGGMVYNKPVNLYPERHPDAIKAAYEEEKRIKEERRKKAEEEIEKARLLREQIENLAFGSNKTSSGSSTGKDARTLRIGEPINPIILPADPFFSSGNNVYEQYLKSLNTGSSTGKSGIPSKADYDAGTLRIGEPINPTILGISNPDFRIGNNVYEQYLRALNTGKNR